MIKTQRILTAIDNKYLYEKIKSEKSFYVYEKDIQYREGILEILKENNKFDILIVFEKIPGNIEIEKLIENIKLLNNKIKIVVILENKNERLEKKLEKEIIFLNDEFNFEEFIKKIKEINFSKEEILENEIKRLKKELEKYKNYKEKIFIVSNENNLKKINLNNINVKYKCFLINIENVDIEKLKAKNCIFIIENNLKDIKKMKLMKNNVNKKIVFIRCKNGVNLKLAKYVLKNYKILGYIENYRVKEEWIWN